ncbi:hypothetical protein F5883DRAFT_569163 [Diaporthe sp. PMI_573]|nr:hypothetical protein F5883DRAFT_569163 [Diaporthaceae sp. PMI_573]
MGFSFLIQSDFVTGATRQDIVATSPRNQGIVKHISDVFIQSVLQFCEHPHLRYTWMMSLPNKGQY